MRLNEKKKWWECDYRAISGNLVTDLLWIFAHDLVLNLTAQGQFLISVTHLPQKCPWKHLEPLKTKEINE